VPKHLLRFVGMTVLPHSLNQQDIDDAFGLSSQDISFVSDARRFAPRFRLAVATQLVVLRATGRPLDRFQGIPKLLLAGLSKSLGVQPLDIATLRKLYPRDETRQAHLGEVRSYAGFVTSNDKIIGELEGALAERARSAASVDDLERQAQLWLYGKSIVLPGERMLRSITVRAFEEQELQALEVIREQVTTRELRSAVAAMYGARKGRSGGTILEWLRTPPGKHGPTTLKETTQKVGYLKTLGVHTWDLSKIPVARVQAYRQAVIHRPPSDTRKLSEDIQALQLACFLYGALLEYTDLSAEIAGQRVMDFVRTAKAGVQAREARKAIDLRAERAKIHDVLWSSGLTAAQKVEQLRELVPRDESTTEPPRAAHIREALAGDGPRLTALLNSLSVLELRGNGSQGVLKQVEALRDLARRNIRELPVDFNVTVADLVWRPLLRNSDRGKALAALKACAVTTIGRELKGGHLWLAHSWRHREREAQLITPGEWKNTRKEIIRSLSLTDDADKYLARVREKLEKCLQELHKSVENGDVTIDERGRTHLPHMEALDIDSGVDQARRAMFDVIGRVQFADMLVEIDARTGFSAILLGRAAKNSTEVAAVYGALLAHGTENDAKGISTMVPGLQVSHITAAMRALEARGRLRDANAAIGDFQQGFPLARLWGKGDKGSADSMSLDTSRYLYSSRKEHRRKQSGVGLYTHIRDSYALFYDQPIVLNTRQAASAVEGVENFNAGQAEDAIRISLLAVDTHGYTNAAVAVAKLLGFDLCVWLRDLSERKIYLPSSVAVLEGLDRLNTGRVSVTKIRQGWDELLRLVASIRRGHVSPREALSRLGSAAKGDPAHDAADELGKLLRSVFLCDFLTKSEFRRELRTLLNRGESVHQLQRAVYHGRLGHQRGRRGEELQAVSGAHALLTNVVLAWNTMKMNDVMESWKARRHPIENDWMRRMGPGHFAHINFKGTIAFPIERYAEFLLRQPGQSKRTVNG